MNITVYLAAHEGFVPKFKEKVHELGKWIGENGHTLIYGGSNCGLMGAIADSVLEAGGKVIGIEPEMFIEKCLQHTGITKLIVTKDLPERKAGLINNSDAFIAFPGGLGTLDEISEVMVMVSLKIRSCPCIVYNLDGYYDHLKAQFQVMIDSGLSTEKKMAPIHFADTLEEVISYLK
ncbi:MAG: TIGR00730 family Rossman fold protein [Clostridia bacterium]|nr:TIGR00730 family Rossman fold protein [Clostridia bacterium]